MGKNDSTGPFTAHSVRLTEGQLHNIIDNLRSRCPTGQREEAFCSVSNTSLFTWLIVDLHLGAVVGVGFLNKPGVLFPGLFERRAA